MKKKGNIRWHKNYIYCQIDGKDANTHHTKIQTHNQIRTNVMRQEKLSINDSVEHLAQPK